jgi:hypothetical protein
VSPEEHLLAFLKNAESLCWVLESASPPAPTPYTHTFNPFLLSAGWGPLSNLVSFPHHQASHGDLPVLSHRTGGFMKASRDTRQKAY